MAILCALTHTAFPLRAFRSCNLNKRHILGRLCILGAQRSQIQSTRGISKIAAEASSVECEEAEKTGSLCGEVPKKVVRRRKSQGVGLSKKITRRRISNAAAENSEVTQITEKNVSESEVKGEDSIDSVGLKLTRKRTSRKAQLGKDITSKNETDIGLQQAPKRRITRRTKVDDTSGDEGAARATPIKKPEGCDGGAASPADQKLEDNGENMTDNSESELLQVMQSNTMERTSESSLNDNMFLIDERTSESSSKDSMLLMDDHESGLLQPMESATSTKKTGDHGFNLLQAIQSEERTSENGTSHETSTGPLYLEVQKMRLEEQARQREIATNKKRKFTPESELRYTLDNCSRFGDVNGALEAYEQNRDTIKFDLYNYNVLLYLYSSAALGVLTPRKQSRQRPDYAENHQEEEEVVEEDGVVLRGNMAGLHGKNEMGFTEEMMDRFLDKGLEIYEQMLENNVLPNEATFTALARLAVAKLDGDLAFDIVTNMVKAGIPPKLRCYGPALYVFFKKKEAEKALNVYDHMAMYGVEPEEAELEVLLHLSSRAGLKDRVYSLLHRLRETVRDVSPSTVSVIERWFTSDIASASSTKVSSQEVRNAAIARGGGWHGLGWLGNGKWNVGYTQMSKTGVCGICGEQMVTIDITPEETESFAKCVAALAFKREHHKSFKTFEDWLDRHGPYSFIVDGANVGFFNQRTTADLNFAQLNSVVSEIQRRTGKWPLVVLHTKRTTTGSGKSPLAQQLISRWSAANALYTAPVGSNDDWYWLYAAVKFKSLLVSNDEMRDHIFQLLGREFFPTWKERHQVRFHVTNRGPVFHMPPPYSIIIQESVHGSWHVPVSGGDDISTPRRWLCATRQYTHT